MGNADVTVHQLLSSPRCSDNTPVWLNVFPRLPSGLGVWGTIHNAPAYIVRHGDYEFGLVQFETKSQAAGWFKDQEHYWKMVASVGDLLDEERTE